MMPQFSRISFCKLVSRYPSQQSSRPISSIFSKSHQTITNQCLSDSISPPKPTNPSLPISKFHSFLHPIRSNASAQLRNHGDMRKFSSESVASFDQNKEVDEINLKFAEAREEIDMALESKETVYFNEEAECARAAVKEVLDMFDALMGKVSEKEKGVLQRSMGLKMEQLKAELEQLNE